MALYEKRGRSQAATTSSARTRPRASASAALSEVRQVATESTRASASSNSSATSADLTGREFSTLRVYSGGTGRQLPRGRTPLQLTTIEAIASGTRPNDADGQLVDQVRLPIRKDEPMIFPVASRKYGMVWRVLAALALSLVARP